VLRTPFTEMVGCSVPIQLAPMGAVGNPELAAAVTGAGGMAMLATARLPVPVVAALLDGLAALGAEPAGINVLMPYLDLEVVELGAARVKVVDFYHGPPDTKLVDSVHGGGALAAWQVGSVDEARAAVDAGCDFLIVRGVEGGGRMWGSAPLWQLLDGVLEAVEVPVLAAGGLGTARHVAAALAAGAAGVRLGTRFLATQESTAHPLWKEAVIAARPEDTVLTDAFSVWWPNGPEPHRVLRSAVEAAGKLEGEVAGEAHVFGEVIPLPPFCAMPPNRDATGAVEAMALYAGESVAAVHSVEPAGAVVRQLAEGAERLLSAWGR
jgi:NAD(P)H-dependent flavin oxidoreductase YrpB (nitropropane dioxygenase family)